MTEKEAAPGTTEAPVTTAADQEPGTVLEASDEGDDLESEENVGTVKQASEEGDDPDTPGNTGTVKEASEEGATPI